MNKVSDISSHSVTEITQSNVNKLSLKLPTPVKPDRLEVYLCGYNYLLKKYLLSGFRNGFRLDNTKFTPSDNDKTLKSARIQPDMIDNKLDKEIKLGRIQGPFKHCPFDNIVISPLGLVEKKVKGEYRVIHHLSFPQGSSINDGIPREFATVKYSNISDAISNLVQLGKHSYMAKSDIKSAFRIIPINPLDYHLLGMKWKDQYYYDRCLPMGASSSCQIFEKFSTALQWITEKLTSNCKIVHVLDDFMIMSETKQQCKLALKIFLYICEDIGVPIAPEKTFDPDTKMQFLGIDLDTEKMQASIPDDKVTKFIKIIEEILESKSVTLKKLQSLTGMLNFACGVILPARAFSRRLYNLSKGVSKSYHHIKITQDVKLDLCVWKTFLTNYNHKTLFLDLLWKDTNTLSLFTDSSTSVGYGGIFQHKWFSGVWEGLTPDIHINILELYPICVALHLWGHSLRDQCINIVSDNLSIVYVLNSFTSKDKYIMILLRQLVLTCMTYNILIKSTHLSGRLNIIPDLLSRGQVHLALEKAPYLDELPTLIPPELKINKLLGI